MRIVIAGGTGFLGRPLASRLAADGHEIVILSRRGPPAGRTTGTAGNVAILSWQPDGTAGAWADAVDGAGAVVNLAGESIAGSRWSEAQKARLVSSRVQSVRSLVAAIDRARQPPPVFISNVGTGYYGDDADQPVDERAGPGRDFLARLCVDWEAASMGAASLGSRVVLLRTGVVLERDGGALAKMLPAFRLWVGGPIGSGYQPMSWIHRADWVAIVRWSLETPAAAGPVNATAPRPVTNEEFAATLGRVLGKPARMRVPALAIKALFGEMGEAALLGGQRAIPARALELGFRFTYPDLESALRSILR